MTNIIKSSANFITWPSGPTLISLKLQKEGKYNLGLEKKCTGFREGGGKRSN
jgi:hypothetical protein